MHAPADPALILGEAPVALLEALGDGELVAANAAAGALLGVPAEALVGRRLHDLLTPGGRFFLQTHCLPVLLTRGEVHEVALEVRTDAGERRPVLLYARRDAASGRLHVALAGALDRRLHDEELRRMRARERGRNDLHALTASLSEQALRGVEPGGLYAHAVEGLKRILGARLVTVTEWSSAGAELRLARGEEEHVDRPLELARADTAAAVAHFATQPALLDPVAGRIAVPIGAPDDPHGVIEVLRSEPGRPNAFELEAVQAVASVLWVAVVRFHDVRAAEHRSLHDPLTGLANRQLLLDRLEHELLRARRSGSRPAVLFVDLDDFKLVNDSLGHRAGDRLLQAVATALTAEVREADTVARLGGDEFVVLCPDAGDVDAAEELAARVRAALGRPVDLDGHRQHVRASVGLALADPSSTAEQLLGDADTAMYRAKAEARGEHVVFDASMRAQAERRLRVESELHEAIGGGQLCCHFQPIVELAGARPVGLEALVRWQHPERGLLPPAEFLGVAQQAGLMDALGAEVLRLACSELARLRARVPSAAGLHLTVNVSVSQLVTPQIVPLIDGLLRKHELDDRPGVLRLEVTESLFVDREDVTQAVLEDLRRLGVTVLIDDFGTGFSSLSRLRLLPIDGLKIDRSFIAALGPDGDGDGALITAILELAAALRLDVVCEGVETAPQRDRLRALGGGVGQGHLFARALPPAEVLAWLRDAAA